jgi:hypothetical protein
MDAGYSALMSSCTGPSGSVTVVASSVELLKVKVWLAVRFISRSKGFGGASSTAEEVFGRCVRTEVRRLMEGDLWYYRW